MADAEAATQAIPYLADRAVHVTGIASGEIEMSIDPVERTLGEDGAVHCGAVLGLIDAAGASVPWTVGAEAAGGVTVSLSARFLRRAEPGALRARARVRARDERFTFCDIDVRNASSGAPVATASLLHRFSGR
ncbi:hypothetical protein GEV43_32095 [Actinomadura sp. J1-007]|uniref:PaaI family thioesterase n=1 Tax=Actinomadura sp. J1-007 TaxID=2661913 RepID=UPI0013259A1C|nr:hotdog domain-containing protein [Actinomadura sp. J1-007]MWK38239.1 hypothetical protein [Actinomadura sp. J1-007]